jgi:hypothetical protein
VSIFIYENRKSKVSNKNENIHKCDFIKSLKYNIKKNTAPILCKTSFDV